MYSVIPTLDVIVVDTMHIKTKQQLSKQRWNQWDEKCKSNILQLFSPNPLTASISLRAFHCSYWTPRASAVWMVLFIWLVHTLRSRIFWPLMKAAKAFAYWKLKQEPLWGAITEIVLESDLADCFQTRVNREVLTFCPRGERPESPPIRPNRLSSLSPWRLR